MISYKEYIECMNFLNYHQMSYSKKHQVITNDNRTVRITASYNTDAVKLHIYTDTKNYSREFKNLSDVVKATEYLIPGCSIIGSFVLTDPADRSAVMAAINTRNLAQNLVRVKSSNVWAYGLNVKNNGDKTGDLIVQFKNKNGGPGNIYIYYSFPVKLYQRWQSAPSVGHFFYVYIRNNFKYSKLTGDRRGKLPNAINH